MLAVGAASATAQNIAGRFVAQNQQGGTIVLILMQDAQRQLTGSLTAGNASFKVEGMVDEDGTGVGAMSGAQATVFFQAELNGSQLILTLIEPGANNMPDYSRTREIAFTRQGDAEGPAAPAGGAPRAGGNPLAQSADPFTGTFTGDQIALELSRRGTGYAGTLTVQGQAYPATATAQGNRLAGTFTVAGQQYQFQAQLQNDQLMLVSDGATYQLARAGGGAAAPANPLAAGGGRAGGGGGGSASLLGTWSCQTGSGSAQLGFVSESQLTFNGEATAYQLVGSVVRVQGDYGPVDYRYQLSGDQLVVTGPDGSSMQCRRGQAGSQPGTGGAALTGMEGRLRGRVCSFSSSADGGMSTLYSLEFDGQGHFTSGNESSYSGDPGSAYGRNRGNVGTYRIGGLQVGSPIIFVYPDGKSATGYVGLVEQGEITAVRVNGRLYGKTICQ
jgi:hypothetical protein